jgi:uncharacterized OsmC-like protein
MIALQSCSNGPRVVARYWTFPSKKISFFVWNSNFRSFSKFPKQESDRHNKSYVLRGETTGGNLSGVTVRTTTGFTIATDLPAFMGGHNQYPQPVEYLLASYIGCTQATAAFVARNMQQQSNPLELKKMEFHITGIRDERGAIALPLDKKISHPSRITQLSGTITVFNADKLPITIETLKILKEQTELRCPIANMLHSSGCIINVDWIDGNAFRPISDEL